MQKQASKKLSSIINYQPKNKQTLYLSQTKYINITQNQQQQGEIRKKLIFQPETVKSKHRKTSQDISNHKNQLQVNTNKESSFTTHTNNPNNYISELRVYPPLQSASLNSNLIIKNEFNYPQIHSPANKNISKQNIIRQVKPIYINYEPIVKVPYSIPYEQKIVNRQILRHHKRKNSEDQNHNQLKKIRAQNAFLQQNYRNLYQRLQIEQESKGINKQFTQITVDQISLMKNCRQQIQIIYRSQQDAGLRKIQQLIGRIAMI